MIQNILKINIENYIIENNVFFTYLLNLIKKNNFVDFYEKQIRNFNELNDIIFIFLEKEYYNNNNILLLKQELKKYEYNF